MDVMLINHQFDISGQKFRPGELYLSSPDIRKSIGEAFADYANKYNKPQIFKAVSFTSLDRFIKAAHKDGNFKNLMIIRLGGIGDLIALSSIIDYFDDKYIHLFTNKKYFPIFDWFENKPKVYGTHDKIFTNFSKKDFTGRFFNWARFQAEGLIERGHKQNWYELFFNFIGEKDPGKEFYRPQLKTERINDNISNIQALSTGKKSLLICNKSTIMMRTCHAIDIFNSLHANISDNYDIFVYETALSDRDKKELKNVTIIPKTDLANFLLDCYDADNVISVDTGAIHFREGINKKAIGLYNSFTVESRTKYYTYTKSYDIKSACELQPCFIHEKKDIKFCPKGDESMFAAPCFDSESNEKLIEQLKEIFKNDIYCDVG